MMGIFKERKLWLPGNRRGFDTERLGAGAGKNGFGVRSTLPEGRGMFPKRYCFLHGAGNPAAFSDL